jgi:hypothetical protein
MEGGELDLALAHSFSICSIAWLDDDNDSDVFAGSPTSLWLCLNQYLPLNIDEPVRA